MADNTKAWGTTHPIAISVGPNLDMGCFDVHLMAGNFETEEAASEYAQIIAEFLEDRADGEIVMAQ